MANLLSNAVYTSHYKRIHRTQSSWVRYLEFAEELANKISSSVCGKVCNDVAPPVIGTILGLSLAVLLTAVVLKIGILLIRWIMGRKNSERVFYLNGLSAVSRCESSNDRKSARKQTSTSSKPERIPYASYEPKTSILSTIEEKSKPSESSHMEETVQPSTTSQSSSTTTSAYSFKPFRKNNTSAMKTLSIAAEKAFTSTNYYGPADLTMNEDFSFSTSNNQPRSSQVSFAPMDERLSIQPSLSSSTADTESTAASSTSASSTSSKNKDSDSPSLFEWITSSVSGMSSAGKHRPRIGHKEGIECFLFYESDSSGRLIQQYLQGEDPPEASDANMVIAWRPKAHVPNHKIRQHGGRRVLIGNCSVGFQGRHNYCNGVCQFIKDAIRCGGGYIMVSGAVGSSSSKMLSVSVYLYLKDNRPSHQTLALKPGKVYEIPNNVLAIACLFQTSNSFYCNMTVDMFQWLADGERNGSSTRI